MVTPHEFELLPIESIRRLDVKPGDTLVITLNEDVRPEEFDEITSRLRSLLPEDIKIIVTTSNVDFGVSGGAT